MKVALITGGNRGIGLETARQLGKLGVTILLGARDLAKGKEAAEVLRGLGVETYAVKLNVLKRGDHAAVATWIKEEFGQLDILINNAAVNLDKGNNHETSTVSQKALKDTFETNFFAVVELTQTLLPLLKKSAAGRIVNVSSSQGSLTMLAEKDSVVYAQKTFAYDASKTALNSFTIHLAHELQGTKIKVNAIHPGWVKTDMGGQNAHLELADGAKTSVRLAMLGEDGPSGGYFYLGETIPW